MLILSSICREFNSGHLEKYKPFWEAAKAFLDQRAFQAADSQMPLHCYSLFAAAPSTRDFVEQIAATVQEL